MVGDRVNDYGTNEERGGKEKPDDSLNSWKTNDNGGVLKGKKPCKSVTLLDDVKSREIFEIGGGGGGVKREDSLNRQTGNKCLRGILKSRTNNTLNVDNVNTSATTVACNPPQTYQIQQEPLSNVRPKYFGIKSYIDSFYYPPDSDVLNSGEFIQDDFEFVVEPGKRRWRNCWFKVGLWSGINLLLLGIIALLVGHLTPPRETVVARVDNIEVLDRSAMSFNLRLHLCRLSGITIFCIGGIVLMLTFLISSYNHDTPPYYVANTSSFLPDGYFMRTEGQDPYGQRVWAPRIPLSGILKPVQPR